MAGEQWTDVENDRIVEDYFSMLAADLRGQPYNKAEHNRRLQDVIGRTRTSVEFKHQNISAVLKGMGEDWIAGYKPAFNFQMSLADAVDRWLSGHPDWVLRPPMAAAPNEMDDPETLWVGPPPTYSNEPPPAELEAMLALARKFDVAARDERNRVLGRAGEALVFARERSLLRSAGRRDLAERVRWVAEEDGDGAGFDIHSFRPDGRPRLIEVKTTNGWERTPFFISRNEVAVADAHRADWSLLRLWNFAREPKAFELFPPLDAHVTLTATSFQADFR